MKSSSKRRLLATAAAAVAVACPSMAQSPFSASHSSGYVNNTSLNSAYAQNAKARLSSPRADRREEGRERILFWYETLNDLIALDHTPDETGRAPLINGGPTRSSRAQAIVTIAMYDALCVFSGDFECYTPRAQSVTVNPAGRSRDAAVAYAAYETLLALYPNQQTLLDIRLGNDIQQINAPADVINGGRVVGEGAAEAILNLRTNDGAELAEVDFGGGGLVADGDRKFDGRRVNNGTRNRFQWQNDPETPADAPEFQLALGAFWGAVTPFALTSGDQFRLPPPPETGSTEYVDAYNDVYALGVSPEFPFATGTPATYFIGNYWGYDGVPLVGVPPRLYGQIASQIAARQIDRPLNLLRFLAAFHVGLADAAIAAWDSKYFYNYARPVSLIRRNDGVPGTPRERDWTPFGTSIVNVELEEGQDFFRPTPPFPAYPSGHATFGAVLGEFLREIFGDDRGFTFISDEYNGIGVDPLPDENGEPTTRPLVPVRFANATEAQAQNGRSRVFNGVHWSFDDVTGQDLGVEIARWIFDETPAFKKK
ncbi:MAG: vanadium-dependent haloperoxidase [Parvularculaceae bacterium]